MNIKVGDIVTWRQKPRPTIQPLGISGAKVLELGETGDGKPAARLYADVFGEVNALLEDLELEQHE